MRAALSAALLLWVVLCTVPVAEARLPVDLPTGAALSAYDAELVRPIPLGGPWRFKPGDDSRWAEPTVDDSDWAQVQVPRKWETQGHPDLDGYAWYRVWFQLPSRPVLSPLAVELGQIDDADEVYLNGVLFARSGRFPPNPLPAVELRRVYPLPHALLRWGEPNLLAVRVYDRGGAGGIVGGRQDVDTYEHLLGEYRADLMIKVLAPLLLFLFGLYHLLQYRLRRTNDDAWFFAWSCFAALYAFCRSPLPFAWEIDLHTRQRLLYASLFLAPPLFHRFTLTHFRWPPHPAWDILSGLMGLGVGLILIEPDSLTWFNVHRAIGQPITLALLGHSIWLVRRRYLTGDPEAGLFVVSALVLAVGLLAEMGANALRVSIPPLSIPSILLFDAGILVMLARRYAREGRELAQLNLALEARVKERTAELETAQRKALERNEELAEFTSVVSHELKEPLRSIEILTQFLEEDCEPALPAEGRSHLARMRSSVRRLQQMVDDLLRLSRLTMGEQPPTVPVDVEAIVRQVITQLTPLWPPGRAQVEVGELPWARGLPGPLEEVFRNLISNGVRYNRSENAKIQIEARSLPGGRIQYLVKDNGIGIEGRYHAQIFEPFKRLHTQQAWPGTGLGLTIARKIVRRQRGELTVQSEVGQGSTFVVELDAAWPPT